MPEPDALETLAEMTRFRDGFQLEDGAVALSEVLSPAVASLLAWLRRDESPPPMQARQAAKILGLAGDDALIALIPALEDPYAHTRIAAAFALLWQSATPSGDPHEDVSNSLAADALVFSLSDESPDVRAIAAVALGKMRASRFIRDLNIALKDADARVVISAAMALGELGETDAAVDALAALVESDKALVAGRAAEALGVVGGESVEERLFGAFPADDATSTYLIAAGIASGDDADMERLRGVSDERAWVRDAVQRAESRKSGRTWQPTTSAADGDRPRDRECADDSDGATALRRRMGTFRAVTDGVSARWCDGADYRRNGDDSHNERAGAIHAGERARRRV